MRLRDARLWDAGHETIGQEKSLTSRVYKSRVYKSRVYKSRVTKVITIVVVVITLVLAVYIMLNRKGVVEDYDFGAGAYYYADIPTEQYNEIVNEDAYHNTIPQWIYYVFFFAWGWLMWRLWIWVDGRKDRRKK